MSAPSSSPRSSFTMFIERALDRLSPEIGSLDLRVSEGELRKDLEHGRPAATLLAEGKAGAVR